MKYVGLPLASLGPSWITPGEPCAPSPQLIALPKRLQQQHEVDETLIAVNEATTTVIDWPAMGLIVIGSTFKFVICTGANDGGGAYHPGRIVDDGSAPVRRVDSHGDLVAPGYTGI